MPNDSTYYPLPTSRNPVSFLLLGLAAHGQTWNQATTFNRVWLSMAGSQHGSNLVAAAYSDETYVNASRLFISTNGGQNWQPTSSPTNFWTSVASSSNGMRLVAGAVTDASGNNPSQIFISADGGLTWTNSNFPVKNWSAVSSSSSGQILVGAAFSDGIYVSTNYGANWSQSDANNNNWNTLAISSDGRQMYATTAEGVYFSTNTGANWNLSAASPPNSYSIVCSADGKEVFTGIVGGSGTIDVGIYVSTNSGATWSQTSVPIDIFQNYFFLSMSTYGDVLLTGAYSSENRGLIYLSNNGGATWIPQTAPTNSWGCVFCSADGTRLTAGEYNGSMYSASNPVSPPKLALASLSNHSVLSWPIFPAGFQLQTASSLTSGAWTNTPSIVAMSGTNYFTTNGISAPNAFFRLARP
jgi:hypothetical protein